MCKCICRTVATNNEINLNLIAPAHRVVGVLSRCCNPFQQPEVNYRLFISLVMYVYYILSSYNSLHRLLLEGIPTTAQKIHFQFSIYMAGM